MDRPELDFRNSLLDTVKECRKIGYNPTAFIGMMNSSSAFDAVRTLLAKPNTSDGFTELWEKQRLDLSVEAIVLKPEWRGYFSQPELETARRRLGEVKFRAPWDDVEPRSAPEPYAAPAASLEIDALLASLDTVRSDKSASKRLRIRLRELGYTGELRQRGGATTPRTRPADHTSTPLTEHIPIVLPPVADAETLLTRIRALVGLPERNHEDVVKDLLIRLGFDAGAIVFQRGRIDLSVQDVTGKTAAVFEVKRTIAVASEHSSARRQGMDYANQTGAPIVVITDGDRYEVYDRRKGQDYVAMLCGRFRLTAFNHDDAKILDLLRPEYLRDVWA